MSKIDKSIADFVYGNAMGSALGLITRPEHKRVLFPYGAPIYDYVANEWTACTQFLLFVIECNGNVNEITKKLETLHKNGSKLYDGRKYSSSAYGLNVRELFITPGYFDNPIHTANSFYEQYGGAFSPLLPVIMAMGLAFRKKVKLDALFDNTVSVCALISPDPRVVVAAWHIIVALRFAMADEEGVDKVVQQSDVASYIIKNYIDTGKIKQIRLEPSQYVERAEMWTSHKYYSRKTQKYELSREYAAAIIGGNFKSGMPIKEQLEQLIINFALDSEPLSYSFKGLAAAVFAFSTPLPPKIEDKRSFWRDTIITFAEGCDTKRRTPIETDYLCSIVGAILAFRMGKDAIHRELLHYLPNKPYIDDIIGKFIIS